MNTQLVKEALLFGWNTFKKRPWFFVGLVVVVFVAQWVLNAVLGGTRETAFMTLLFRAAGLLLGVVVEMMSVNIALRAHDSVESVTWSDAYRRLPLWQYVVVKLLQVAALAPGGYLLMYTGFGFFNLPIGALGFVLFAAGMPIFLGLFISNYLVIDRGLSPIEAVKESWRVMKGNRLNFLLFLIVVACINMLGAFALIVGLLVTVPVTMLAMVHAYRTVERKASEIIPA